MAVETSELAAKAFESHEVRRLSNTEWSVKRPGRSEFWAHVLAGEHGHLLVYGDIDPCVFAYGPKNSPEALVRWIGGEEMSAGHEGYVAQKAAIGMGCREAVWEWDADTAVVDAKELGRSIDAALPPDVVRQALYDDGVEAEDLADFGMVIAPRVYYAHAALRRVALSLAEGES